MKGEKAIKIIGIASVIAISVLLVGLLMVAMVKEPIHRPASSVSAGTYSVISKDTIDNTHVTMFIDNSTGYVFMLVSPDIRGAASYVTQVMGENGNPLKLKKIED